MAQKYAHAEWPKRFYRADGASQGFASASEVPKGGGWMTLEDYRRLDHDRDGKMGGGPAPRHPADKVDAALAAREAAEAAALASIPRDLKAVHKAFGRWIVVDAAGKQVADGLTKADADDFNGLTPEEREAVVAKNRRAAGKKPAAKKKLTKARATKKRAAPADTVKAPAPATVGRGDTPAQTATNAEAE